MRSGRAVITRLIREKRLLADELKSLGAPVLVSTKWPVAPTSKEDREEQPLRVIRDRQLAPTTPAALAKSGVLFALVSGAGKTSDYFPGIRKAIDNGLSADDALRATTINPAARARRRRAALANGSPPAALSDSLS